GRGRRGSLHGAPSRPRRAVLCHARRARGLAPQDGLRAVALRMEFDRRLPCRMGRPGGSARVRAQRVLQDQDGLLGWADRTLRSMIRWILLCSTLLAIAHAPARADNDASDLERRVKAAYL